MWLSDSMHSARRHLGPLLIPPPVPAGLQAGRLSLAPGEGGPDSRRMSLAPHGAAGGVKRKAGLPAAALPRGIPRPKLG